MRRAQILTPADAPPDAARMRALGWDVEEAVSYTHLTLPTKA